MTFSTFFPKHIYQGLPVAVLVIMDSCAAQTPAFGSLYEKPLQANDYLIGSYQYKDFIGTLLWKETDPDYLTDRMDPGKNFMERVRSQLKDLPLKGSPRQAN